MDRIAGNRFVAGTGPIAALVALGILAGCAVPVPNPKPPAPPATAWQAPLPHGGDSARLADWWRRFDDPVLSELITSGQRDNPSLAAALARIDQARASARIAGATLGPTLDGSGQVTRSKMAQVPFVAATIASVSVDAAWELDLFGANRRGRDAALARFDARSADWHAARVSLAAETATSYADLRLCEAQLAIYREDVTSQRRTLDLTQRKVKSGFTAPADAALIMAGGAEASNRVRAQRGQCDLLVKGLVALTGLPEAGLRERLAARTGQIPQPAALAVAPVPAALLSQRPDLAALERELVATSAEVGVAEADRYPRLRLTGSIGFAAFHALGTSGHGLTWSFGPGLSLPIFDGRRRSAAVDQANARFAEAVAVYRERATSAVREVEEALVRLDSATDRLADADRAADSYQTYLKAVRTRYDTGTGTVFELEDARRSTLNAAGAQLQVRSERVAAWLSLYKALGGGWNEAEK